MDETVRIIKELQEDVKFLNFLKRKLDNDLKITQEELAEIKQMLFLENLEWAREFLLAYSGVKKEFIVRDREVICLVGNELGGRAVCSKDDKFAFVIGKALAFARATGREDRIPDTLR